MLDALALDLTPRDRPRALALVDHVDAAADWLVALLIAALVDARRPVVLVCIERAGEEILKTAKKLARRAARAIEDALEDGSLACVETWDDGWAPEGGVSGARARARAAGARAGRAADARAGRTAADAASRVCFVVDGVESLDPRVGGAGGAEAFLDALVGEGDVCARAHGDVGALAGWIAETCDCEVRLVPLVTGVAEDAQGTCETTHRSDGWRMAGEARRTRVAYAVTELGARFERRSLG